MNLSLALLVRQEGALQPVIGLLSSRCTESQREAALLLGQFATATVTGNEDYKVREGCVMHDQWTMVRTYHPSQQSLMQRCPWLLRSCHVIAMLTAQSM